SAVAAQNARAEARALAALAAGAERHTAALLRAASADAYRRSSMLAEARKEAELALDLDTTCSRAGSVLANVATVAGGRDAAAAIERSLGLMVPRAWLCDALARSLESIGEHDLAFAWTHRWLALAPSDRRAMSELLRRCQLGTDPRRIAEALMWVLAQPDPSDDRAPLLLDVLTLLYNVDQAKSGQVARKLLDVLGPTPLVRDRLGALADEHDDAGLAIALLERTVAADASAPRELLLELAHRRLAASDFDGASQELLRASNTALDPAALLDAADEVDEAAGSPQEGSAPPGLGSDGVIALAEVRARCLAALLAADLGAQHQAAPRRAVTRGVVSEAWRVAGAMRWDLADDPRGAELALFSAAEAGGDRPSFQLYARDLAELAGAERAVAALFERLQSLEDAPPAERLALALAAGNLAAEHGLSAWALDGALAALAVEPSNTDAIALAESQAPHVERGDVAIDHIYEALAHAALGMFGRRAAHYRAARQLERLGARELALIHALKAFEAVPTEGTSWSVLTRLVDPVRGSFAAVELFQRIATTAKESERADWFRRAIELSGHDREGIERRFDVLLRALSSGADAPLADALLETVERMREDGGLPIGARGRLATMTREVVPRLEGPDGARTAARLSRALVVAGARTETDPEREALEEAAFRALDKAVEIDGEVEVFGVLTPSAPSYAAFVERGTVFVASVVERIKDKRALVGPPLLRFTSAIADALTDARTSADLLDEAERREAKPTAPSGAPPPIEHEDPFADPSLLESAPPPPAKAGGAPRRLELKDSDPPPTPPQFSFGSDSLDDLAAELAEHTAAPLEAEPGIPPARRSSSGTFAAGRVVPDLAPIRDGFDALFQSEHPPAAAKKRSVPPAPPPPEDIEALEEASRMRGDHEGVAKLLGRRIEMATSRDEKRVLKLRRAAVLEQRLGRPNDARRELDDVLASDPNDKSALSFLADLLERRGEHAEAGALFARLSGLGDDGERRTHAVAAARAYTKANDTAAGLKVLDSLPPSATDLEVARTRVELFRKSGDVFSLVLAIDQLIATGSLDDAEVAKLLVEGSRSASSAGDQQGALIRARRASRLAPTLPEAVLELAALEYKNRGTGTPREAQAVVDTLQGLGGELSAEQTELHTFLLAETLDVIQGGGAGLRELSHRHAEVGPLPLIALGMAERLSRSRSFEAAVPLFTQALDGDLRGMRSKARVSLAAADAAIQSGHLAEARAFLEEAEQAPELRTQIERRRREILAFDDDLDVARPVIEELLKESTGSNRARLLQRLARMTLEADFERAVGLYEEALLAARRDRVMADKIRTEILEILEARGLGNVETIPAPASGPVSSPMDSAPRPALVPSRGKEASDEDEEESALAREVSSDDEEADSDEAEEIDEESDEEEAAAAQPSDGVAPAALERSRERVDPLGPLAPTARPLFLNAREETLFEQLLDGYVDAGDALVDGYAAMLDARARDVLVVRRHQVALKPGIRRTISALREAALAERDEVYARALEHALAVDAGKHVRPPSLHAQPREPEHVSALLFRDVSSRETEILAIAWEAGMFRRELSSYGVVGSDRVPLTASTVLGEGYSEITAVLGSPRPLFHKRDERPGTLDVALVPQPALVAVGEFRAKTPELVHKLASVHASASPELVLAAYLDDASMHRLFEAMMVAFGPVRPRDDEAPASSASAASFRAEVARLASELWQRINPRAERRLRDLCELGPLDPAIGRSMARRAMRRAGLFASGDLGLALRLLAHEEGRAEDETSGGGVLERACEQSAEATDLVRLATRMEFAEARWQLPAPGSIRR
ncbi:MAG: hypothetical protein HOW73_00725, partial [Polyangiaceae bacterium]|nr:hypothetical protein [Polyangiaceae bacterium]